MQISFGSGESPTGGNALSNLGQNWINGLERIPDADRDGWKKSDYRVPLVGTIDYRSPDLPSNFRHKSSPVQGVALYGGGPFFNNPINQGLTPPGIPLASR
jgi:hypothetical protein